MSKNIVLFSSNVATFLSAKSNIFVSFENFQANYANTRKNLFLIFNFCLATSLISITSNWMVKMNLLLILNSSFGCKKA